MPTPGPFDSRVALVTGAARGIGRAVALELARQGANLVLTDLQGELALLEGLREEIAPLDRGVFVKAADVSSKAEVDALVEAATRALGGIDVLVNNAGIHLYPSLLRSITETDWDRVQAINVKGPLFLIQAVLPGMIARGRGAIVNVASDSAFDVIAGEGAYGISKIALVRLSAYFAKELAGTGVRVNSLAPGWVRTRLTREFTADAEALQSLLEQVPNRRVAEPQEIADAAVFLASDRSSYVNGHCLVADGGRIAGIPA